jgi:hypothetical protein
MESIFDEREQYQYLTDREIFLKIWFSPREVFKYIIYRNYDKYVTALLILAGVSRAFNKAADKSMGDTMSLWAIIGLCVFVGGVVGWCVSSIYASLINWTGKWLKGQGDTKSILSVMAYVYIPSILSLILLVPELSIYGVEIFKTDGDIVSAGVSSNILFYGALIIEAILGVWTVVLLIIGVAEAQQFSIGKSILNLLLPIFIIFLPLFLLGILVSR